MTIKSLYPASRPALGIDFAKTKRLDPRVAFTRASTGTFVDNGGIIQTAGSGVPRFDHNPTTGESLGLLVEEARTNYLFAFASPSYNTSSSAVYSTYSDSRFGATQNAHSWTWPSAANAIELGWFNPGSVSTTGNGVQYTISYWAKANQAYTMTSRIRDERRQNVTFAASLTTSWQYFSFSTSAGIADDGTGTVYFWWLSDAFNHAIPAGLRIDFAAVNLERGGFPTSYIPTSGATATRAADVATLSNANSSIFPTSAFTTVNTPFGTAGGGSTVKLVGPTIKRTAIYDGDLPQAQINTLTNTGDFWRWRVLGSSFALPSFTTNGSVTVDWGDGTVQTLTTGVYTFTNGGGYHDIGFRLNSGTFFKPNINNNATYKDRVIAVGPAPASMRVDAGNGFYNCTALRGFDATVNATGGTSFSGAWRGCTSLVSFPLVDTSSGTNFNEAWFYCPSLTSFPLVNTSAGITFQQAWRLCTGLTSFPLINTGAATSLRETWYDCAGLTSFPLINTGLCADFYATWQNCTGFTSFPLINTGAGTNFQSTWHNCNKLTSFPLINTAAGTSFVNTWRQCSSLTSFPLISTGAGINFTATWFGCSGLTSFPLINTAAGTTFDGAWQGCSGLTSFPAINTAAGTNFQSAWISCSSLTSFPSISFAAATTFQGAWFGCSSLATFPANMFDTTGTLVSAAFTSTFQGCALTAASIENILTSLVTNGQSNITLGLNGGTNAGASTWTTAANTAYVTLTTTRGWIINRNA